MRSTELVGYASFFAFSIIWYPAIIITAAAKVICQLSLIMVWEMDCPKLVALCASCATYNINDAPPPKDAAPYVNFSIYNYPSLHFHL